MSEPFRLSFLADAEEKSLQLRDFLSRASTHYHLRFETVVLSGFWAGYLAPHGRLFVSSAESKKVVGSFLTTIKFLLEEVGVRRVVLVADIFSPAMAGLTPW